MAIGSGSSKEAKLISINVSSDKGTAKKPADEVNIIEDYGIDGDAHGGSPVKQVSLLDRSEIEKMEKRTDVDLYPGDFAENLTSEGIDHDEITVGSVFEVGDSVELVVSQIGKACHDDCIVKDKTGECIMPGKGLFFKVLKGGTISTGDTIRYGVHGEE